MSSSSVPSSVLKKVMPIFAVAAVAIAFAGCEASVSVGGDDGINADEAASSIGKQYTQKTGLKLDSMTCESGKPEVGATFNCNGVNESGVKLVFTATVDKVDDDSSNAHFTSDVTKATVPGSVFENAAIIALAKKGTVVADMKCPAEITLEKGKKVDCVSTSGDGAKLPTVLTLTDKNGAFDVDVKGPPVGNPS